MRLVIPCLLSVAACALPGAAQDDPVESRRYSLGFFVVESWDRPGSGLSLAQESIGTRGAVGQEGRDGPVDSEELVVLLRREVAPGSWEKDVTLIETNQGVLTVRHRRSVQTAVAAWLSRARALYGRRIRVDAAFALVAPERWGRGDARTTLESSRLLKSVRFPVAPGQRVEARDVVQTPYVRDHDVQIGTGAGALDPVVDVVDSGTRFDVRVHPSPLGDAFVVDFRCELSRLEALDDLKLKVSQNPDAAGVPKDWEATIQLPKLRLDRFRGQVAGRAGEPMIAGAAARPDGMLALFLTCTFEGPAPEPAAGLERRYYIGALIEGVQDWAGPRPGLMSPSAGGGGPLTGATFTLDEPRVGHSAHRLKDTLRIVGDPPSTPAGESRIEAVGAWIRVAGAAPRDAVERVLSSEYQDLIRTVSTEAVLVAFKPGALAGASKAVPALAPGGPGSASDEEIAALLEEARKGGPVRLASAARISGREDQRVYLTSGHEQAYVQDFEPQVSTSSSVADPIVGILDTGLGFDVRPSAAAVDGSRTLELRCWLNSSESLPPSLASTGVGPIQRYRLAGPRWEFDLVCPSGRWTLAVLESRGEGADAEDLALFVRILP